MGDRLFLITLVLASLALGFSVGVLVGEWGIAPVMQGEAKE